MKYYLIGIKGSGMASLASLLKQDGNEVIGKDVDDYIYTQKELNQKNIKVLPMDDKSYLDGCFVIVGHDFYQNDLIEELKNNNIEFLEYNKFLAKYLKNYISVAGTNGKTTLTALLKTGSKNASCLRGDGVSIRAKKENYFFLESCEYKDHFLVYNPDFIIITNITYDHVDYFKSKEDYQKSFINFANKSGGLINYKYKDIIKNNKFFTYGLDSRADFYVGNYEISRFGIKGTIYFKGLKLIDFNILGIYGEHLIEDVLATFAFYYLKGEDLEVVKKNLCNFKMPNKRFNLFEYKNVVLINDYAHQPEQIEADFNTVKKMYKNRKLIAFYRPDRISRLEYFKEDFIKVLNKFDKVYLVDDKNKTFKNILLSMEGGKISYYDKFDMKILNNEKYVFCLMSSKNLDFILNEIKRKILK